MKDRLRQAAVLLTALLQAASPGWAYVTKIGQPIWTRSDAVTTAATPATYAFGIWSFIFLTSLGYAIYSALPGNGADPLLRKIGWWSALAFALNAIWGVLQQVQGVSWETVVVIFAIAFAAARAFAPVTDEPAPTRARSLIVAVPLGVLAGWITAASPVNIDQALAFAHVDLPISKTAGAVLTLLASAGLVSALLPRLRGHPTFVAAAVWALIGVAVANVYRTPDYTVAAVAGGLAVALVLAAIAVRRRGPGAVVIA